MTVQQLQEQYEKALEDAYNRPSELSDDLELAFWHMIEDYLDSQNVVYSKSRQSESVYIETIKEIDEDGDIIDDATIRVAMHDNGRSYDVEYIEKDFVDMMKRLEKIIQTEEGVYCEK